MNEWKEIKTQEDIDEMLDAYGGFHDGCLIRAAFQSGTSVNEELAMCFGNAEEYTLHVTFERQWRPKTLEMNFIGLRQFHLVGVENNHLPELFEAYLTFAENLLPGEPKRLIVWSDAPFELKDLRTESRNRATPTLSQTDYSGELLNKIRFIFPMLRPQQTLTFLLKFCLIYIRTYDTMRLKYIITRRINEQKERIANANFATLFFNSGQYSDVKACI